MSIKNFIVYHNPLGKVVRDFVTESELQSLIRSGYVKPYDYELRGNFWFFWKDEPLKLEFYYNIHSYSYPDVL